MLEWRAQRFKIWIPSTGQIKRFMTSMECIRRRKIFHHVNGRLISCTIEEICSDDAGRWKGVIWCVFISLPRNLTGAFLCITEGLELCEKCFWTHLRTQKYSYPLSSRSSLFIQTVRLNRLACYVWFPSLLLLSFTHGSEVQYALILNSFASIKVLLCEVRTRVDVTSAHVLFTSFFFNSSCRIWCTDCLERLWPRLNGSY